MAAKWMLCSGALGLLTLSGCALVPGSDLSLGREAPPHNAAVDFSDKISVKAITPELVAQLRAPPVAPSSNSELDKSLQSYEYLVGPGDVLSITVWEHPELMNPLSARAGVDQASSQATGGGRLPRALPILLFPAMWLTPKEKCIFRMLD